MMKIMMKIMTAVAALGLATGAKAQEFNNWTTESVQKIFVPPPFAAGARWTTITRVHGVWGEIKTVTFSPGLPFGGYEFQARDSFSLIEQFLRGPNADLAHQPNSEWSHYLRDGTLGCHCNVSQLLRSSRPFRTNQDLRSHSL
jgi:hypothetical protein